MKVDENYKNEKILLTSFEGILFQNHVYMNLYEFKVKILEVMFEDSNNWNIFIFLIINKEVQHGCK